MSTPQQPLSDGISEKVTPPQLAGLTLPQPAPNQAASGKESSELSVPKSEEFLTFVSLLHSYLWSCVTFADQKAGFIFAVDSAFLGYLFSAGLLRGLKNSLGGMLHPLQFAALLSFVFLGGSILLAIIIVMPQLKGHSEGLIYFKAISNRASKQKYAAEVLAASDPSLNLALAEHCYEVAKISTQKYLTLKMSMWFAIFGFISGFIFVGLVK